MYFGTYPILGSTPPEVCANLAGVGRRLTYLAVLTFLLSAFGSGRALAQEPGLEFVAPESVATTVSDGTSDEFSVWLKNATATAVTPSFKTVLEDSDGDAVHPTLEISGDPSSPLPADDVGRYRIKLEGGSDSSGQLVATAPSVAPATVAISVGKKSAVDRGVNGALLIPLVGAAVLMALAWWFSVKPVSLGSPLGSLEFKFSESFASSLTTTGALLGTIISAGVLPEETVVLSKAGFTGLNLIFGVGVIVAGLVYSAAQKTIWKDVKDDPTKQERKLQGYVWPFLLAAFITVWAVFGELWTLWLLVEELSQDNGFSGVAVCAIKVLLAGAAIAMVPYTLVRIRSIVKGSRSKPNAAAAFGPPAPQPLRTVSLL
jgi:hypothetical protein